MKARHSRAKTDEKDFFSTSDAARISNDASSSPLSVYDTVPSLSPFMTGAGTLSSMVTERLSFFPSPFGSVSDALSAQTTPTSFSIPPSTATGYSSSFRLSSTVSKPAKPKSPLYKIVSDFPGSWDDLRLMKALLLDYYPQDKLLRNLLLTSAEEHIPHKLITNQSCNKSEFFRYAKLIVNAHGCSIERAKEIIFLWVDALEIDKRNLIDEYPGHDKCL